MVFLFTFNTLLLFGTLWKIVQNVEVTTLSPKLNISSLVRNSRAIDSSSGSCTTPEQLTNGRWSFLNSEITSVPGQQVPESSVIVFRCNTGYTFSSLADDKYFSFCQDGSWDLPKQLTCQKLCPVPKFNPVTTTIRCNKGGFLVPCNKATHGTTIKYICEPFYENFGSSSGTCVNGRWSSFGGGLLSTCIPKCGEKRVSSQTLIVNGHEAKRGNYPWVVAIYSNRTQDNFKHICGGSLISVKLVITAAHCVTNQRNGNPYPTKFYRIAAGKYYNEYEDPKDEETSQYSGITDIKTPPDFKGEIQNFRGDIAILRLKSTLKLSNYVQPVCYRELPDLVFNVNQIGIVTGWGKTSVRGELSDVLKELEIPYQDETTCRSEFDEDFESRYFTPDKMCAGFFNKSTSVCSGDSGGGLVFKNINNKRYYLYGIVSLTKSVRENNQNLCDTQKGALFTRVSSYFEWLQFQVDSLVSEGCTIPEPPANGEWVYSGNTVVTGDNVAENSLVIAKCFAGYKSAFGEYIIQCLEGEWNLTTRTPCGVKVSVQLAQRKVCIVPETPINGKWVHPNSRVNLIKERVKELISMNETIPENGLLFAECNSGFKLVPDEYQIQCLDEHWNMTTTPLCKAPQNTEKPKIKEETSQDELCKDKIVGEWFRLTAGKGDNCRDVVRCNSTGGLEAIRCPTGLYFDIDQQACDWSNVVKNCNIKMKERKVKPLLNTDKPLCSDGFLACGNGKCIEKGFFCDGKYNCADESDESTCGLDNDPNRAPKCDPTLCVLPDCFCSENGTSIPGDFLAKDIPQMITITFNGAINSLNIDLYNEMFNEKRKNPNRCNIRATFFVAHKFTNYSAVQEFHRKGHEIAVQSITNNDKPFSSKASVDDWSKEMAGQRKIIETFANITDSSVVGVRAPYLRAGGHNQFLMMEEQFFIYDSTIIAPLSNPPKWPYTLYFQMPHRCLGDRQSCPVRSYSVWEMVINELDRREDPKNDEYLPGCHMVDSCSNILTSDQFYNFLNHNFDRHYEGNRAPLGLHFHFAWLKKNSEFLDALLYWIDEILENHSDVYFTTMTQVIDWIQNPVAIADVKDFVPWKKKCTDSGIPACRMPNSCKLTSKEIPGETINLQTCLKCPHSYPWVNNLDGHSE